MGNIRKVIFELKPAIFMVMVQIAYVGLSILYKFVAQDGMSMSVLIAYRTLFATSLVVPLAFFMERKRKPKITPRVLLQAFFCALFGVSVQQNLFLGAVALASATYATAMTNLIPGATFILALCFGLERFNIRTSTGKAKVIGTLMGIGGAMILTFYKSIEIHIWSNNNNNNNNNNNVNNNSNMQHPQPHKWSSDQILGCAMAFGTCLCYAIWLIIQARMCEKFPWQYTSAALMSVMGCIQVFIFALCIERDWNQWKLGWNMRLLTAVYTGILPSGLVWILITWCVRLKGPVYASAFNPLCLVLVVIVGPFIYERLYLGSIIGSIVIVLGLYMVLWGKSKELENLVEKKNPTKSQLLEIITTNHRDDDDGSDDIKSHNIITTSLSNFLTSEDELAREGQEQGKEGNEENEIPLKGNKESNLVPSSH